MPDANSRSRATLTAEEALVHIDALYGFALRLSRSESQAEDLVQDTFTRCLTYGESFEPGTNLKAWLFRILRNVFLDQHRRQMRNPAQTSLDDPNAAEPRSAAGEPLRGDPEIDRLRGLVAEDIEAALGRLSADQRLVVLLDLEGFSEAELASVLTCAPGTIKSRLARARAILREQLREYAR